MRGPYEKEEFPLPLVKRIDRSGAREPAQRRLLDQIVTPEPEPEVWGPASTDRMSAGVSGALAGLFAGGAALGIVQAVAPSALAGPVRDAAAQWGVTAGASFAVAYGTAAALGALVGAGFANVTRYLRRWVPLLIWSLVFFVSLALLLLAMSRTWGGRIAEAYVPAILAASAVYAAIVSLALPLRRRGKRDAGYAHAHARS